MVVMEQQEQPTLVVVVEVVDQMVLVEMAELVVLV